MPTIPPAPSPPQGPNDRSRPKVIFDWRDWLPLLDNPDIPEAEARACIEAVWAIVLSFMDLKYEIADREKSCGQDFDLAAALGAVMVNLEDSEQEREDA